MFTVYILKSLKDNRSYVGYIQDLDTRQRMHNNGRVKSTKNRRPLEFIFKEEFKTKQEAKARELWWKSYRGRQKMKELF